MSDILQIINLSKIYGDYDNKVTALDNVSLSIKKGEFVAVVGASGSGKSTLMHIMGGVDKPSSGWIAVDGIDLNSLSEENLAVFRRRQVGLIYQFYNLVPILTVKENILLPLLLDGRKPSNEHFDSLVESLGLADRLNHLPNQLSGGQQQRVSIARAVITNPTIVLADEPTGNLDSKNSSEILNLLKTLHQKLNQTIVVITHNNNIARFADRIITIQDGKIAPTEG